VSPTTRLDSAGCWIFWLSTVTVSWPGIEIAIETDKGLFVAALVAAGFMLFFDQSTRGGSTVSGTGRLGGNPIVVMR
jgi:hypothetical protein